MRRTYGTGSITLYDGKYIARVRIDGVTKKKTCKTHAEAENWLREINVNNLKPADETVGTWLVQYIKTYKQPFLRKRSLERVKQAAYHLEPIYNIPLQELTPSVIQTAINDIGLSASTVKKSFELLKAALKLAVAERIIAYNPADAVVTQKVQRKPKVEIFTRKEIGAIFHAIHKIEKHKYNNSQRYDMILFFRLLLTTGLRISELLALKWENVNMEKHMITVEGSKDIDSQTINAPKTESGVRDVPLLSVKTRNMLYAIKPQENKDTSRDTLRDTFVFSNRNGGAMSYQRAFLTWRRVRELTGITKKIHCFRHTCVSYLLTYYNIPIAQVAAIAGHSSAAVTLSIYTHAIQEYNLQKYTSGRDTFRDTSSENKPN